MLKEFEDIERKFVRYSPLEMQVHIRMHRIQVIKFYDIFIHLKVYFRAGVPEPKGAGCFWILGAEAAGEKNRSRSRLEKKIRNYE